MADALRGNPQARAYLAANTGRAERFRRHVRHDQSLNVAVASAYSLMDYQIAGDLGGWQALDNLRGHAWQHGIRLSADMVPNHMGIDSRWVTEHPERFLALPEPPYPAYSYTGPDLSDDPRVAH